jgi:hypothetical protein
MSSGKSPRITVVNVGKLREAGRIMEAQLPDEFLVVGVNSIDEVIGKLVRGTIPVINIPPYTHHQIGEIQTHLEAYRGYFINFYSDNCNEDPSQLMRLILDQTKEFRSESYSSLCKHDFGNKPTLH